LDVGETIESVRQEKQESESVFASFNSSLGALENWSAEVRNALNTLDGNVSIICYFFVVYMWYCTLDVFQGMYKFFI